MIDEIADGGRRWTADDGSVRESDRDTRPDHSISSLLRLSFYADLY